MADVYRLLDTWEERGDRLIEGRFAKPGPLVVVRNALVMTAAGKRYDKGHVIFHKGRIKAVAAGESGALPAAVAIDAKGHAVTPGLIDAHSHLGVFPSPAARAHSDGNEATAPVTAGVWAEHAFWPQDPGIQLAVAGGVTSVQVLPGSTNLIGGRGMTVHLAPHRGARAMRFPKAPVGVKMACGENPKRVYGRNKRAPSTRMGNLRGTRQAFLQALAYVETLRDKGEAAKRDLDMETLVGVLRGKLLAQVHCYRADDMLAVVQVADEFGFSVRAFHHALEAYKIRDILAKRGIAVATWADWWGFKMEAYDGIPETVALLTEAGVRAVIKSDSAVAIQRLNQAAVKAYYAGLRAGVKLTEDDALRWITANPAWTLGIDGDVGSLEVGKRADVVVWDGHPFSVYTRPLYVFIDGHLRYDAGRMGTPWSDTIVGQEVSQ